MQTLPDLCCQLYDVLDDVVVRTDAAKWEREPSWQSLKASFTADVLAGRSSGYVLTHVNHQGSDQRRLYAAVRGFDDAFALVNPSLRADRRTPVALLELEGRMASARRSTPVCIPAPWYRG